MPIRFPAVCFSSATGARRRSAFWLMTVKFARVFKRHLLTGRSKKRKRQLRGTEMVCASDMKSVRAMMPYA